MIAGVHDCEKMAEKLARLETGVCRCSLFDI